MTFIMDFLAVTSKQYTTLKGIISPKVITRCMRAHNEFEISNTSLGCAKQKSSAISSFHSQPICASSLIDCKDVDPNEDSTQENIHCLFVDECFNIQYANVWIKLGRWSQYHEIPRTIVSAQLPPYHHSESDSGLRRTEDCYIFYSFHWRIVVSLGGQSVGDPVVCFSAFFFVLPWKMSSPIRDPLQTSPSRTSPTGGVLGVIIQECPRSPGHRCRDDLEA